jgi:hypothetical protein
MVPAAPPECAEIIAEIDGLQNDARKIVSFFQKPSLKYAA